MRRVLTHPLILKIIKKKKEKRTNESGKFPYDSSFNQHTILSRLFKERILI